MKTPHTIELIYGVEPERYDPILDDYVGGETISKLVPTLVNYITQEKVFELYGSRDRRVIIARFMQAQAPFQTAKYDGRTFTPIERIDAPIKGAVRMQEVADDGV